MEIALTPAMEQLVQKKVQSGLYSDPSDLMREALRLLLQRDEMLEWLRLEAAEGFHQLENGDYLELNRDELLSGIRNGTFR